VPKGPTQQVLPAFAGKVSLNSSHGKNHFYGSTKFN